MLNQSVGMVPAVTPQRRDAYDPTGKWEEETAKENGGNGKVVQWGKKKQRGTNEKTGGQTHN